MPKIRLFILGCMLFLLPAIAQKNDTLYYAEVGTIENLATANNLQEHRLGQLLYDSLTIEIAEGQFSLSIAKDVDISPDGLSFTFILRKNLKWADGTPLTARDVEFTLQILLNPKTTNFRAILAKFIEDVSFINPTALTITLSRPFYRPLSLFTFKILPKHKFANDYLEKNDPFIKKPLGCGPFVYGQGLGTNTITFIKNNNFKHRRQPFLNKIFLKKYTSKKKALEDLLAGKIHLVAELGPGDISQLKNSKKFTTVKYQSKTIHFMAFNYKNSPYTFLFRNSKFRKALLLSLNRSAILKNTFSSESHKILTGPFPVSSWAYNKKVSSYSQDTEQAKELLEEILIKHDFALRELFWYKDGKKLEFTIQHPTQDQAILLACKQIQASLKKMGIACHLQPKAQDASKKFDLLYTKYTFDSPLDIFSLLDPKSAETNSFASYRDPKMIELIYQLHSTLNPWSIQSICHKIHTMAHRETIHLFLWQLDVYAAYTNSLKNVKIHPYYLFNFLEDWKIISNF